MRDKLWGDKQVYNFAMSKNLRYQSIARSIRDNPKQRLNMFEKSENWEDLSYMFSKKAPISQKVRDKFRVHRSTVKNGDLTKQATVDMVSIAMNPHDVPMNKHKQHVAMDLTKARQKLTNCDHKHIWAHKVIKYYAQHPHAVNIPKNLNKPASKQLYRKPKITLKDPIIKVRNKKPSKKLAMATLKQKQQVHR